MFACLLDLLTAASGGFDHYRTGRDLAILALPLAVELGGEMLVVRMRHRLWGGCRCLIRGTRVSYQHTRARVLMVASGGLPCQTQASMLRRRGACGYA